MIMDDIVTPQKNHNLQNPKISLATATNALKNYNITNQLTTTQKAKIQN